MFVVMIFSCYNLYMNFSSLYLETTNPLAPYSSLISSEVLFSVIFHTVAYLIIYVALSYFFLGKPRSFGYFPVVLFFIMLFGYFGRLYRAKTMYNALLKEGYHSHKALEETRNYMRTGYFTYYFLG